MSAKTLRGHDSDWPDSRFERFDLHRPEHLDTLADAITDATTPIAVLTGERGIGRGFLCRAAAERGRRDGTSIVVWDLDLDGFEPDDTDPLEPYLRHRLEMAGRATGAFESQDPSGPVSDLSAAALWLTLSFEDRLSPVVHELDGTMDDATMRRGDAVLRRLIDEMTTDQVLVVHLRDAIALPVSVRTWWIRQAEARPDRLFVVMSTTADEAADAVGRDATTTPIRIDVVPLDADGLRQVLDLRFAPEAFSGDQIDALIDHTDGWPAALANVLADQAEAGDWSLPARLDAEIDTALANAEPPQRQILSDFLLSAAICGRFVPIALPLGYFGLDEEARETAIDWIDDILVDELGWLEDLEFRHPSYPGLNIYAFTHPLLPRAILNRASEYDRMGQAVSLLRFLEERGTPIPTRGMARLFLSIGEHLDASDRAPYAARLAWWVDEHGTEVLGSSIRRDLAAGNVAPELVRNIARGAETWPPPRRLTALEAYAERLDDTAPVAERASVHAVLAELLLRSHSFDEALDHSRRALDLTEEDTVDFGALLYLSGMIQVSAGQHETARPELEQALVLHRRELGESHPNTLVVATFLGRCLGALDQTREARALFDASLPALQQVLGEEHPHTIDTRMDLGAVLFRLGDYGAAFGHQQAVLDNLRQHLGESHPKVLNVMAMLARTHHRLGDAAQARSMLESVQAAQRATLGPLHPATLGSLADLHRVLIESDRDSPRLAALRDELSDLAERSETAAAFFTERGVEL
ncbi:MAG: tetratricopeptide repeat protein [Acidobacteriota bacterium]